MKRRFVVVSLWCTLSSAAHAHHAGYSPGFEPFHNVPLAPVEACQDLRSDDHLVDRFACRSSAEVIVRRSDDASRLFLRERERDTTVLLDETKVIPYAKEAYTVDLNRDDVDDVVVVFPGMGTGLAMERCHVVFLLSSESGRAAHVMPTMGFGPEDIISFYDDRRYQVVHTEFVGGEAGLDGKRHNYWVYHFFTVEGGAFQRLSAIEPRWIMFAGKTNHRPTQQLTDEQKERIWAQQSRDFFLH